MYWKYKYNFTICNFTIYKKFASAKGIVCKIDVSLQWGEEQV